MYPHMLFKTQVDCLSQKLLNFSKDSNCSLFIKLAHRFGGPTLPLKDVQLLDPKQAPDLNQSRMKVSS